MKCPHCDRDSRALVTESRSVNGEVYRRRHCGSCDKAFVTVEAAPPGLRMPPIANSVAREDARRRFKANLFKTPSLNWNAPK